MKVKVLHWNTLADISADTTSYGFPNAEKYILEWRYRFPQIITKIVNEEPDLISLVEVDKPQDFFKILNDSYHIFHRFKFTERREGSMLLIKRSKFNISRVVCEKLADTGQILLAAFIYPIDNPLRDYIFVNVHLKAKASFGGVRMQQVQSLHNFLKRYNLHKIIVGDFNDDPNSDVIKFMCQNYNLSSNPREITTYKCHDRVLKRTIDYIFNHGFNTVSTSVPSAKDLSVYSKYSDYGCPCVIYPSDHFYVVSELQPNM